MGATIPSLWPDDIKVDTLPPLVILKAQAAELGRLTKGIVRAEVTTTTGHDDFVVHRLELLASQLGNRRYGVLSATHRAEFYPVVLEADCFRPRASGSLLKHSPGFTALSSALVAVGDVLAREFNPWPDKSGWRPIVSNQDEFLRRVGEVLRSMEVRSRIDSWIALTNQQEAGDPEGGPSDPQPQPGAA